MLQMKLFSFSAWQLWIIRVAISTDCCCGNEIGLELPKH